MSRSHWEAEERKLQSVYDDIEAHRLASALSTTTRWLKKHPKSQPGLVMKMYLTQKLGVNGTEKDVEKEVLDLYELVKSTGELSSRGFWWTGLTLRNIPRLDLALKLHRDLWAKHPDSLDLANQVFLHAAAAWDVDTMVSSSRKLFNLTRDARWARAAAWTELIQKAPDLVPTVDTPFPPATPSSLPLKGSLKIAQTLLSTTGPSAPTSDILRLRLQILLASGEHRAAIDHARAEGSAGSLARLYWRIEGVKAALAGLEEADREQEWTVERDWVAGLLKDDNEAQHNYTFYRYLLDCATTTTTTSNTSAYTTTDSLVRTLHSEIGEKERAPLLALLELQRRLRAVKADSDVILSDEKWSELVEEYWEKWGSKGSIVTELEGVVGDDEERKGLLVGVLKEKARRQHTDLRSFREQVNAEILLLRNQPRTWTPSTDDAKRLWTLYTQGLLYGKNLPHTEVQPADPIGLMAVDLLILLWHASKGATQGEKGDWGLVYCAIACLEHMLERSPSMHARFLLIRLYRLVGAPSLVTPHLEALKLSEIQLDTVLHVAADRGGVESLLGDGKSEEVWSEHAKKAGGMYARSRVDMPEYVKQAVNEESYSKIQSVRTVSASLGSSLSSKILSIERARLSLAASGEVPHHLLPALKAAATPPKDGWEDLRNWELLREIGGERAQIKDFTAPGGIEGKWDVGTEWVVGLAGMYAALFGWLSGDGAAGDLGKVQEESLLLSEKVMLEGVRTLLKAARKAVSTASPTATPTPTSPTAGTEGTENGDAVNDNVSDNGLKGLFDANVNLIISSSSLESRWQTLQSIIALAELLRITQLVLARLVELSQVKKGKKKPASIVALIAELQSLLKSTKERLSDGGGGGGGGSVVERLEQLKKDDEGIIDIDSKGLIDDDAARKTREKIVRARQNALDRAKSLLEGKIQVTVKAKGK